VLSLIGIPIVESVREIESATPAISRFEARSASKGNQLQPLLALVAPIPSGFSNPKSGRRQAVSKASRTTKIASQVRAPYLGWSCGFIDEFICFR
jgi:hypothetical protein